MAAPTRPFVTWIDARAAASPAGSMTADNHGRHQTFGEYAEATHRVASALLAEGVAPGTAVAWQLPTWIEAFVLVGALARLDAVQVPLLPVYREREIEHAVRTTGCSLVIVPERFGSLELEAQVRRSVAGLAGVRVLVVGERELPEAPPGPLPPARESGDPVRWVFHTSGTTSAPKGVQHADASILASARAFAHSIRLTAADRSAIPFPVAHIGGVQLLTASLDSGCGSVLLDRFVPEEAVDLLAREGVTLAGAGPAFFQGYLAVKRARPGARVLPAVRAFTSGGAPKSPELYAELREVFGVPMVSNYGLTECPNSTGSDPDGSDDDLANTEGVANPGVELSVRGPDGRRCGPGEEGELWVRGPQRCHGYVDHSLEAEAFDADGFFRTGDLVVVDERGLVRVTGRVKDIIIRKGENISAREVEDLLAGHPDVAEVTVVGLPDPQLGERCCAVVVPRDPTRPPTLAALAGFLRERGLMVQKHPEQLELVASLPRNALGKVQKPDVRAAVLARAVATAAPHD